MTQLDEQRAERRADELHQDVDACVATADLAHRGERDRHGGVEVRSADAGERCHEQRQHQRVHEPDHGPVGESERLAGRERHDQADEKHEKERAYELRNV